MGARIIRKKTKRAPALRGLEFPKRPVQPARENFGTPLAADPLFTNPASVSPRPVDVDEVTEESIRAMEEAGMPPESLYAFRKTGLMVTDDNRAGIPAAALDAWEAAVAEYFAAAKNY